jgi:Protein of unknown function (DUF4242)
MHLIKKTFFVTTLFSACSLVSFHLCAQPKSTNTPSPATETKKLFIDVHQLEPGKVTYDAVAGAHAKDLATEGKYGVQFLNFWVDENKGLVYCLSSAPDSTSIRNTHAEAHGMLPDHIYEVTEGTAAALKGNKNLFLDVHYFGAGNVSAAAVAAAHQKDLAVQGKHDVNFINYWVDEKDGVVMCLAQAKDSSALIQTHKEAHGLLPAQVFEVKQGEK